MPVDADNPIAGRTVPLAATRIYDMSFFTGFGVSALVYYLLNVAFPVTGASTTFEEIDVSAYGDEDMFPKNSDESASDGKESSSDGGMVL